MEVDGPRTLSPVLQSRHGRWLLKLLCAIHAYNTTSGGTDPPPSSVCSTTASDMAMDALDAAHLSEAFLPPPVAAGNCNALGTMRGHPSESSCGGAVGPSCTAASQQQHLTAHGMAAVVSQLWSVERLEAIGRQPHSEVKRAIHQLWARCLRGDDDGGDINRSSESDASVRPPMEARATHRCPLQHLAAKLSEMSLIPTAVVWPAPAVCDGPAAITASTAAACTLTTQVQPCLSADVASQCYQYAVKTLRSDVLSPAPQPVPHGQAPTTDQGEGVDTEMADGGWVPVEALVTHWAAARQKQQQPPKKKKKAAPPPPEAQQQHPQGCLTAHNNDDPPPLPTSEAVVDGRRMVRCLVVCDLFLRLQWCQDPAAADAADTEGPAAANCWRVRATYLHKNARIQTNVRSSLRTMTWDDKQRVWAYLHAVRTATASREANDTSHHRHGDRSSQRHCTADKNNRTNSDDGFYDVTQKLNITQTVQALRRDGGRVCPAFRPFLLCCPGAYLASETTRRLHKVHVAGADWVDNGYRGDDRDYDDDVTVDGEGVILGAAADESAEGAALVEAMRSVNDLHPELVFPAFNDKALEQLWMEYNVVQLVRPSSSSLSRWPRAEGDAPSATQDDIHRAAKMMLSSSIFLVMMDERLPTNKEEHATNGASVGGTAADGAPPTTTPTASATTMATVVAASPAGWTIPLWMQVPARADVTECVPLYSGRYLRVPSTIDNDATAARRVVLIPDGDDALVAIAQPPPPSPPGIDGTETTPGTNVDGNHRGNDDESTARLSPTTAGAHPPSLPTPSGGGRGGGGALPPSGGQNTVAVVDYDLNRVRDAISLWVRCNDDRQRQQDGLASDQRGAALGPNVAASRYLVLHLPLHPTTTTATTMNGDCAVGTVDCATTKFHNRRGAISALRHWLEATCGLHVFAYVAPTLALQGNSNNADADAAVAPSAASMDAEAVAANVAPVDKYVSNAVAVATASGDTPPHLVVSGVAGLPVRWCDAADVASAIDSSGVGSGAVTCSWVVVQLPPLEGILRSCIAEPFGQWWHASAGRAVPSSESGALESKLMARAMRAMQPPRNDRMEFLGDAVVDYALVKCCLFGGGVRTVGEELDAPPSSSAVTTVAAVTTACELGERMTALSSNRHLGSVCLPMPLQHHLIVACRCGPQSKALADAFEALMGAVFLHSVVDHGVPWSDAVNVVTWFLLRIDNR